ncbi:carboxylating nicotinate-nucleotide diphosphorylase [Salipaludibacillus daqingensis]|uniref:carboxylating nicotinate-nucleotide diphosphorylase n=1 Tax=Salipaludibacillus daqingensis TaxID=3041001 RepID=UPI0024738BD1|nr:carboxylating nicotinate-nucleotide diphosphorylase [Salipaludibacillus daqingensis]
MNKHRLKQQLADFFQEDIGFGDITSQAIFENEQAEAVFISKQTGIFCGEQIILAAYELFSTEVTVDILKRDGEEIDVGDVIAKVSGPIVDLLSSERVVLNLVQRLSAIATKTKQAVKEVEGTGVYISDTRKTTPGLRMLEKYAVRCGGGKNHRFGLDDAVLIKDNHIAKAGSVSKALQKVKEVTGHMTKIEVEVETFEQLKEAIVEEPDVIMLDNCSVEDATKWCKEIPSHIIVEISGGLTVSQIRDYATTGVNVISMGALTHSAQSLDISLDILLKEGATHA